MMCLPEWVKTKDGEADFLIVRGQYVVCRTQQLTLM